MEQQVPASYQEAMAALQEITEKLENADTDLAAVAGEVQRARFLLDYCRHYLTKTEDEITKAQKA